MPYTPNTTSLDLPPDLQRMMEMSAPGINPMQMPSPNDVAFNPNTPPSGGMNPGAPALDVYGQPGYAMGGMVQPSMGQPPMGQPQDPASLQQGVAAGGAMQPPQANEPVSEAHINQFLEQNPQAAQQVAGQIVAMVQAGELGPEDLQAIEQFTSVALNNPEIYPQLYQYAMNNGFIEEGDVSPQFDAGEMASLLVAARAGQQALQQGGGQVNPMNGGMEEEMLNMADGGYVKPGDHASKGGKVVGPGTGTSDSVPVRVSAGEYVIPAHIVQMKGKEFFDSMLDKYRQR